MCVFMRTSVYACERACFRSLERVCVFVGVYGCVYVCMCVRLCVCVFVVWDGEKENRDIDREGECRVGRALVSLASRPPPRVCKA